jgi:hypothetical protein
MDPTIFLILSIVMPGNMPDIVQRMPEPSLEQCWVDAAEFTTAYKAANPKVEGAIAIQAACRTAITPKTDS